MSDSTDFDPGQSIESFTTVTGCQDIDIALRYLQEVDWNAERAAARYFEERQSAQARRASSGSNPYASVARDPATAGSGIPLPQAAVSPQPAVYGERRYSVHEEGDEGQQQPWLLSRLPLVGTGLNLLGAGFRAVGSVLSYVGLDSLFSTNGAGPGSPGSLQDLNRNFPVYFASTYSRPGSGRSRLNFLAGSSADAMAQASRTGRLMLVYLHSQSHALVPDWCTNVLCDESVAQYINENFVLWGASITSREGHAMSVLLHVDEFPFMVVLKPGRNGNSDQVARISGTVTKEDLVALLRNVHDDFASIQAATNLQRTEERSLREEQELAYQAAVEADRRREEEQRRQEEERHLEERRRREAEDRIRAEAQKKKEAVERHKLRIASLDAETRKQPQWITIRIRMPNSVAETLFHGEQSMNDVYDFAAVEGQISPETRFALCTNFPQIDIDRSRKVSDAAGGQQRVQFFFREL